MNRSPSSDSNLSFLIGGIQSSKPSCGPRVSSEHVLGLPTTPARPRGGPWRLDHKNWSTAGTSAAKVQCDS